MYALVEAHLRTNRLTLRELLAAAYYKRYEKPMPDRALDEDVEKAQAHKPVPYLVEFICQIYGAH